MPRKRKYTDNAQKQAAYRQRTVQELAAQGKAPLPAMPGYRRWKKMLTQVQERLRMVQNEMRNYHDERSEQWQETERAQNMLENIDTLDDLDNSLSEVIDTL